MNDELFNEIQDALIASLKPSTLDENTFVHEVAKLASEAASKHVSELLEANEHLRATVRKMSKVDTGTVAG